MRVRRLCVTTALLASVLTNYGLCKSVLAEQKLKPKITVESEQIRTHLNKEAVHYCGSTKNDLLDMELECVKAVAVYGKGLAIYVDSDFANGRPIRLIYEMLNKAQVRWKQQTGKVVVIMMITIDTQRWIAIIQPGKPPLLVDEFCKKNDCS